MFDSDEKIPKYKVEVQIELDDGTPLLGSLYVKQMQRVSDLLNDPREFLPFLRSDGLTIYLRKATITSVAEVKQEASDEVSDPYQILGVPAGVSTEDLKQAFHSLCGYYHPDRLQSLNLPDDFTEFASSRLVRIIDAYRRVMAQRQAANGNGRAATRGFTRAPQRSGAPEDVCQ